jgi:hypothetical protein
MFRFKFVFHILFVFLFLKINPAFGASSYSDSLVENLNCSKIDATEIYKKMRAESFSLNYHLPVQNWGFSVGLYDLAACWSLARSQRLFFYLARWNESSDKDIQKATYEILEMIRGTSPYAHVDDPFVNEWPLDELTMIKQLDRQWNITSVLWGALNKGFRQDFPNGRQLSRNFRSEIEFYQNLRFHDFIRNLKYVVGDGSRSAESNRETRSQTLRNLELHKLTLLLIRPTRMAQHIVLAKRFELKSNGEVDIYVYDSNSPMKDQVVTFKSETAEFFAPEIVRGFPEVDNPQAPLGVFIVDEKDRNLIEKTLVKYYRKMCQ